MSPDTHEARRRKLKYRAWRRGFIEADLLLGPFVDRHAPMMSPGQLEELERLLDHPDADLYGWITGASAPLHLQGEVLGLMRAFRLASSGANGVHA